MRVIDGVTFRARLRQDPDVALHTIKLYIYRSSNKWVARFAQLTRRDALDQVLEGIAAAKEAGIAVKLNTVALKGINEAEIPDLVAWAHGQGFELTLIEVMPLGEVEEDRFDHYLPLVAVKDMLDARWTLNPSGHRSGGPARSAPWV